MRNKKLVYRLFFLTLILILPFTFRVLAFEDFSYTTSNEVLTVSTTLPNTDLDDNLELDLELDNLDALPVVEDIAEEYVEISTSTLFDASADESLELGSEVNNLGTPTAEEMIKKDVETEQTEWIKSNDKYKQIKKEDTNGEYEVHEYKTSKGEIGYQTFIYDDQGRIIESIGEGVEAESRTWTQIVPIFIDTIIATSTAAL